MSKGLSFALGDRPRIRACAVRRDSRERAFAQRVVATTLGVLRVADQLLLLSARDRVEQFYQKPIPGGCPPDNRTLSRLRDCGAARVRSGRCGSRRSVPVRLTDRREFGLPAFQIPCVGRDPRPSDRARQGGRAHQPSHCCGAGACGDRQKGARLRRSTNIRLTGPFAAKRPPTVEERVKPMMGELRPPPTVKWVRPAATAPDRPPPRAQPPQWVSVPARPAGVPPPPPPPRSTGL